MSAATDLVGHYLGGYKLVEIIGSGSMATVFKAYQPTLERWVAVKVLHYQESSALIRFEREAKAIALLRHRNILIVYEYGKEGDWPYIVMEYVPGGTLGDQLAGQPMFWSRAINLIIPVAEALWHAHGQGIIHRDVKPSNILLPQPDWPLLADFGLVKLPSVKQEVTRAGMSIGTPAYVAPEQARGAGVEFRSDMYSLGVILFEMVTGRLPFNYANPNKMLLAQISEPLPSPREFNSECPPGLEEIIITALQKTPQERYKDMGQMIAALRNEITPSLSPPQTFYDPPARNSKERQQTRLFRTDIKKGTTQASPQFTTPPPDLPLPTGAEAPVSLFEAKILIADKNTTLNLPEKETIIIGRTHRDTIADIDLGPYGAAQVGVSRHHARLMRRGSQWFIDDMGSLNGTFVNETPLKSGAPMPLKNGDLIRCSHMSLIFLIFPKA